MGWAGMLALDPRWFANVGFVVLVWRTLSGGKATAPVIASVTLLLALASFASAAGCTGGGGAPGESTGLALGGYLWVAAVVLAVMANLFARPENAVRSHEAGGKSG